MMLAKLDSNVQRDKTGSLSLTGHKAQLHKKKGVDIRPNTLDLIREKIRTQGRETRTLVAQVIKSTIAKCDPRTMKELCTTHNTSI